MMRQPDRAPARSDDAPLFSTRDAAGHVAARSAGKRKAAIRQLLRDRGPMTCFELAAAMGVADSQISGRITDMLKEREIERTGQTKNKPSTGCPCDIYRLCN